MRLMGLGGSHVVFIKSLRLLIKYKDVLDKQKKIFSCKKKKKKRSTKFKNFLVLWSAKVDMKFAACAVKSSCLCSWRNVLHRYVIFCDIFFLFSKFPVKWIEHLCAKITQTCFCQTLWFIIDIYHRCSHAVFLTV